MVLHSRSDGCQIIFFWIVFDEVDSVWVAHRDTRPRSRTRIAPDCLLEDRVSVALDGNPASGGNRFSHPDSHAGCPISVVMEPQPQHAGTGLNGHLVAQDKRMIDQMLGEPPDSVSAHLCFGTVRVVHSHRIRGNLRWTQQQQSIGTNAEMPVAHLR